MAPKAWMIVIAVAGGALVCLSSQAATDFNVPGCTLTYDSKGTPIVTCKEPPQSAEGSVEAWPGPRSDPSDSGTGSGSTSDLPNHGFGSKTGQKGSCCSGAFGRGDGTGGYGNGVARKAHSYRGHAYPTPPATGGPGLTATRELILPEEEPPRGVAAYGIVAFTAKPLAADLDRAMTICATYKSTLLSRSEARSVPVEDQMITFWPVLTRSDGDDPDCRVMIDQYDLKAGLDAITDADTDKRSLAQKRGPFLIAWSPSTTRRAPNAVILIVDFSAFDSASSFQDVFKAWRQKVIDDPRFWRNGFSVEGTRLALRDLIDKYGNTLLPFLGQSAK